MSPNPRHTARILTVLGSLALLAMATPVSAQLVDLPGLPALPAVEHGADTPVGSAGASLADGRAAVCADAAASTAIVDTLPVPALPVPVPELPVDVPAAGAELDTCARADLNDLTVAYDADAKMNAADHTVALDAGTTGTEGHAKADAGFFSAAIDWILSLF